MLTKSVLGLIAALLFFPVTAWAEGLAPAVTHQPASIQQNPIGVTWFSTETGQVPYTHHIKVLMEEMTLVQVVSESYARIEAVCAGVGLKNVKPSPNGPMVIIPNAGDLSVDGSNVAIRISETGEMTFIPRVPGQRIRLPMDLGDKLAGQEVTSLTFLEGMKLMAADKLYWTARDKGPYGNGHGLPGHIASCDPRYSGDN